MSTWEEAQRQGRQIAAMWRAGPHVPMATRAEVIGIGCRVCSAEPGEECRTAFPHTAWTAALTFGSAFSGVHMRRYLDLTRDPR